MIRLTWKGTMKGCRGNRPITAVRCLRVERSLPDCRLAGLRVPEPRWRARRASSSIRGTADSAAA